VRWTPITVNPLELPAGQITYYKLYMDDGLFGDFVEVSYTTNSLTQITVKNLTIGHQYRFKVIAANFNQVGPFSEIASFYACQPPGKLSPPIFVSNSGNLMSLRWT
jgi:hypothetical protein